MTKDYELLGKIGLSLEVRVSARGSGLCVQIPKEAAQVHNIIAGDHLKIDLKEHYRKKQE